MYRGGIGCAGWLCEPSSPISYSVKFSVCELQYQTCQHRGERSTLCQVGVERIILAMGIAMSLDTVTYCTNSVGGMLCICQNVASPKQNRELLLMVDRSLDLTLCHHWFGYSTNRATVLIPSIITSRCTSNAVLKKGRIVC